MLGGISSSNLGFNSFNPFNYIMMYFRLVVVKWIINLISHFRDFILNFEAMRDLSDANGNPCCEHELLVRVLYSCMVHTSDLPLSVPQNLFWNTKVAKHKDLKFKMIDATWHHQTHGIVNDRFGGFLFDPIFWSSNSHWKSNFGPGSNSQIGLGKSEDLIILCFCMPRAGKCPN